MLKLTRYATNPFSSTRCSIGDVLAFTTDSMQKMAANNPGGIFTARLGFTNVALTNVSKAYSDGATTEAIRKARKQVKDEFRKSLWISIGKVEAIVEAKYGLKSPQVTECFPQGRSLFQNVRDDGLGDCFESLLAALLAHQADIPDAVTLATDLQSTWKVIYEDSETSAGAASHTVLDKRSARKALAVELFKNLLTIAMNFPDEPGQIIAYMQQSLLEKKRQPEEPATSPTPAPAPA